MGHSHDQTKRRSSRFPTIHRNRNGPHQAAQLAIDVGNHKPSYEDIQPSILADGSFSRRSGQARLAGEGPSSVRGIIPGREEEQVFVGGLGSDVLG